jgi:hypothetical protein
MQNETANSASTASCPYCCPNRCPGCGRPYAPYWAQPPNWPLYPVYPWYTPPYTITWGCNSTSTHEAR